MVDRENRVQLWNASTEDLWGLRADEVEGQEIFALDIGLPLEELRKPLAEATSGATKAVDLTLDSINRRGRSFSCELRVMPLVSALQGLYGGIVLMREPDVSAMA